MRNNPGQSQMAHRPITLAITKLLLITIAQLPLVRSLPLKITPFIAEEDGPKSASDPSLWLYLGVSAALVLLGGAFAGLTIALMGQVCHDPNILE